MKLIATIFILCLLTAACPASPAYPIKISSTNPRILVDQNNKPWMMIGDSPWCLIGNIPYSDQVFYIQDRAAHGFNTLLFSALMSSYIGGSDNGQLLDGTLPFTNTFSDGVYDLTTPNTNYFAELDRAILTCATNGIVALVDPIETGGYENTLYENGSNSCRTYGEFLGNRYQGYTNLMWCSGNDFEDWSTDPMAEICVRAVAMGITDYVTNQLQTIELNFLFSSSYDDTNWISLPSINQVYSYFPVYAENLHAYMQADSPTFYGEGYYDFGYGGNGEYGSPGILRRQEYPSVLCGTSGQLYGNNYTYGFVSGWDEAQYLDSTAVTQLVYLQGLFANKEWYNLLPDTNHIVFTNGYGIFENNTGTIGDDTYLSAAYAPDGTLAIAYAPTVRTITVNMAAFTNSVTACWFDPGNAAYCTVPGSPFSNVGTQTFTPAETNSVGDTDWVLLLQAQAVSLVAPNVNGAGFSGGEFMVSFSTVVGQNYELQGTTNLGSGSWVSIGTNIPGTGGIVQIVTTNTVSQSGVYRVKTTF
jgi:hypothetical protein